VPNKITERATAAFGTKVEPSLLSEVRQIAAVTLTCPHRLFDIMSSTLGVYVTEPNCA
jgi:hypothetical protein